MGAYEGLSNYFEKPLCEYAISLGYDESNILILKGDVNNLKNSHLNIYQNLLSCQHHSDRRTPLEYGQDLVASWIFEDFFINEMQNAGFDIQLSGADRTRLILPNQSTSTISDYLVRTINTCNSKETVVYCLPLLYQPTVKNSLFLILGKIFLQRESLRTALMVESRPMNYQLLLILYMTFHSQVLEKRF